MGAAAAITVIGTAFMAQSNIQSHQANDRAQAAADKATNEQNALMADAKKRSATAESSAQQAAQRDAARNRQLAANTGVGGAAGGGFGSTILSSPLGSVGQPPPVAGGKTLLGS